MTDTTPVNEAMRRRAERMAIEEEVRADVIAAGLAFLDGLNVAEDLQGDLKQALKRGRKKGISDNKLSQYLTEAIPVGTRKLGRPVPRALMGIRRLTNRAPPR